ncbi:MAG: ferrous iron transporter B [Burkholderiaceae bacterium]
MNPDVNVAPDLLALVGNPNCGKTAMFNRLTGARQKVANYAGVTVERKEGRFVTPGGRRWRLLDLPGAYSLNALTPDEVVTRDVVMGMRKGEALPAGLLCIVDATNLRLNLRLVLELRRLGRPMLVVLNMMDVARRRGYRIDVAGLQRELGVPVVEAIAVQGDGQRALLALLDEFDFSAPVGRPAEPDVPIAQTQREVRRLFDLYVTEPGAAARSEAIDRVVLHPIAGPLILMAVMFVVFQAVFTWAEAPMSWIEDAVAAVGNGVQGLLPDGLLRGLLVDGVIAGAGSVLVFLPQILILFLFILVLEESGYLPRAAFLLDRLMGGVGLSGRAFIPLLSSFACAVPGIMAARTIQNVRDRITTIMIAPLMTCSARLPVYALIIAAFIPDRTVWGVLNLQGLVLFALYMAGIVSALLVAWVIKLFGSRGAVAPLLLQLPDYHWPNPKNVAIGLWERATIFIRRVGTIILALMVILWFLSSFPSPPDGATGPAIEYSFAGYLGRWLEVVFAPIGFNWQICIALIPGLAAREVAVAALGTVYAMSESGDALEQALTPLIAQQWGLPTALSLLAWYVFAPQCIATLSVVRRETASWRYPLMMAGYLFGLAYLASFITYRVALALA